MKCNGAYCAAICPKGYRSRGQWRVKCQANNTWSHSEFSACTTCFLDLSEVLKGTNVAVQKIFRKNLPVTQIFCGDESNKLAIEGHLFKQGGKKRNIKCVCRNGQDGDPAWRKSCGWMWRGEPFGYSVQQVATVSCKDKGYIPREKIPEEDKRTIETINGNKYEVVLFGKSKPKTSYWLNSKKLCEDHGMELPVPDSDAMNDFLVDFASSVAPGVDGQIHLGIEIKPSKPNEDYKFNNIYTNEAISYSNWHRLEPSDPKTGENLSVVGLMVRDNDDPEYHKKWWDYHRYSDNWQPIPVYHICMKKISN